MSDAKCEALRVVYEDFMTLHRTLELRFQDLCVAVLRRIAADSDLDVRTRKIQPLMGVGSMFLAEYSRSLNGSLRRNRRSFLAFLQKCVPEAAKKARGNPLEGVVKDIDGIHSLQLKAIGKVRDYMAGDKAGDNEVFTRLIEQSTDLRGRVERSRILYMKSFATLNFSVPLVLDGHFAVMYVIKAIRAAIVYVSVRVARQWFGGLSLTGDVAKDDLAAVVRRLGALLLLIDAAMVAFLYGLDLFMMATKRPASELWGSLLMDSALNNAVTLFAAGALARILRHKRYFDVRNEAVAVADTFVDLVTYMSLCSSAVPYFMML